MVARNCTRRTRYDIKTTPRPLYPNFGRRICLSKYRHRPCRYGIFCSVCHVPLRNHKVRLPSRSRSCSCSPLPHPMSSAAKKSKPSAPVVCPLCGQNLSNDTALRNHLTSKKHSDNKPFPCGVDDCSKSFTTKQNCIRHRNSKH